MTYIEKEKGGPGKKEIEQSTEPRRPQYGSASGPTQDSLHSTSLSEEHVTIARQSRAAGPQNPFSLKARVSVRKSSSVLHSLPISAILDLRRVWAGGWLEQAPENKSYFSLVFGIGSYSGGK